MIVSFNWLKDYVPLDMDPDQLAHRLSMAGLNHESTKTVADDLAIDLEITSNRPDCLGHIGVAREIAVLYNQQLRVPGPAPAEGGTAVGDLARVRIDCPELCYRYTARVIRGVRIAPSPRWLADRLEAIGVAQINNLVDITNFVLMECGQPLHAFDLAQVADGQIIVRQAKPGETFEAIDHRTYRLERQMCVIADPRQAIALGGVMGGAATEISQQTTDVLIESAEFAPLSIRNTARRLGLHSPSSYRFERGVDPTGVDWASRRCCELVLDLAGGELASGVAEVGRDLPQREPVVLRLSQLPRVLGIDIEAGEVRRILRALGCEQLAADQQQIRVRPPCWRRDLTREIDLVEETARIHGYDEIPEDVGVPMAPSHRSDDDRVQQTIRSVMTAAGFDEALTCSIVPAEWVAAFHPWNDAPAIQSGTPMKGVLGDTSRKVGPADQLRRSLIPSLLEARRLNESVANAEIELFETARVYLASPDGLPREPWMVGLTSGHGFHHVKGVIEGLLAALKAPVELRLVAADQALLDAQQSCELQLEGQRLGFLGRVADASLANFGLRAPTTVAEIRVDVLRQFAVMVPQFTQLSPCPAIARDFNFVVAEGVRWADLASTVRSAGGQLIESINFLETYRDPKQRDGAGKKRLLLSVTLRAADRTLTREEAEAASDRIVTACQEKHAAALLS